MNSMIQYRYFTLLTIGMILVLGACQKKIAIAPVDEDFETFYDRFHEERDFQLDRVAFPLEGQLTDDQGTSDWTREGWEMHRGKVTEITASNYDTEIIRKDNEVTDKVKLRDAGFYIERRFEQIKGRWFLVYYEKVDL
ncbi:MAG: hypothetical protein AAGC88_06020 [Bacteroidota bacterium]